ncbi:MAG: hypothetical protein J5600_02605 [Desulfovibrio sp.]|nr:hypothetical protein [Desulfovibrio sp.]
MSETPSRTLSLVLGPMPLHARPDAVLAAGPWCFAGLEDFFPRWEEEFTFAPDILSDRAEEDQCIREAEALAADAVPALAQRLAPGTELSPAYWETLLAPHAITVAKLLVQHWHLARAMVRDWADLPLQVELLPEDCSFRFGEDADVVLHGALNPKASHWVLSLLLRSMLPQAWTAVEGAKVEEVWQTPKPAGLKARLRGFLRSRMLALPFPVMKGMTARQALAFSSALRHPSRTEDRSRSLAGSFSSQAQGLALDIPKAALAVFEAFLPESIRCLRHPKTLSPMAKPRVRAASILLYEDARYRQDLARWRGRGGRLLCVQHGGNYGQMRRICAMEMVEYSQHAFATWGWTAYDGALGAASGTGNFLPLPHPQLARQKDSWRRASDEMIFVGTEMPTVAYQLDSHPTPAQFIQYREDKQWFLEALGPEVRKQTLYRPYFKVPGTLEDAEWIIPRFPQVRLCQGPLGPQILGCRLLCLDHHGTTLLEAMAAGIPTLCYWNPAFWPVTPDFDELLGDMASLGMWHASAELCAEKVREVWDDPAAWWHSESVQAVRRRFLARFANLPEDPGEDKAWLDCLRSL